MNTVLHYDVTGLQVSNNDDGTVHVVFTVPDCPTQHVSKKENFRKRDAYTLQKKLPSGERKAFLASQVAHTQYEYVKRRTNTTSLQAANVLGECVLIETLSAREQEVLEVLAQGASNQEIACVLTIALNTVKRHVKAILAKLGVSNRTQAVTRALKLGLLTQKSIEAS